MKSVLKKILPKGLISVYHLILAYIAAVWFRHPSEKMIVVGVTGTSGKSSVIFFLRQILETAGLKVGVLSTVEFCVAGECKLNDQKMTMLGRMQSQRFLRRMVEGGCTIAIVETTSEGYLQYRHRFINYDIMVLTNLYPEHLQAHGGFENYKAAKLGIFKHVAGCPRKSSPAPHPRPLPRGEEVHLIGKTAIVNGESEFADEFLAFPFDTKIKYTASNALPTAVLGKHTPINVAAALTVARELGVNDAVLKQGASSLKGVPGRIELIPEAEKLGFRVIVDYAFEPVAMAALYEVVEALAPRRIIHVFGATGGGRDRAHRGVLGKFIAQRAHAIIVTNEDPYDDDPMEIIQDVASAAEEFNTAEVLKILDRKEAIQKALSLAQKGDMVLITGKGSEQAMVVKGGRKIPWDDRVVVREIITKL